MNGDDYVIDGDLAFSNFKDALRFYQAEYHKQQAEIEALKTKEQKDYEIISDLLERNVALKSKTLTDEEIYEVWRKAMQEEAKIEYSIYATQLERQPFLYFARAILRKAQEK